MKIPNRPCILQFDSVPRSSSSLAPLLAVRGTIVEGYARVCGDPIESPARHACSAVPIGAAACSGSGESHAYWVVFLGGGVFVKRLMGRIVELL